MSKVPKNQRRPASEEGLLVALKAIDQQISRALERSPAERDVHGVQKWQPLSERVEQVSSFIMQSFADREVKLDSLLVCSQAFAKCLQLICTELGSEGLGELRTSYSQVALEAIARDAEIGSQVFREERPAIN